MTTAQPESHGGQPPIVPDQRLGEEIRYWIFW